MKNKMGFGREKTQGLNSGSIGNEDSFSRFLFSFFSCRLGFLCFDIPALCTTRNGIWSNLFKGKSVAIAISLYANLECSKI